METCYYAAQLQLHRSANIHAMYTRLFRVDRPQHVYLTFLTEAHEGLCTVSTVDQQQGIVRISAPSGRERETDQFIAALQHEIGMTEVFDIA